MENLGLKVLKDDGLKLHIPIKSSWDYEGNKRHISIAALIDSGAEASIFDTDFVEQIIMQWVKWEKQLRLQGTDGSLLKRSGIVHV